MRVVRLITRLNIGGPTIQAINLSTALDAAGYRTLLVHGAVDRGEAEMSDLLQRGQVERIFMPSLRRPIVPLSDVAACWQTVRLLRRVRPAIIHTHTAKAGAIGRVAAVLYNLTAGRHAPARIVHTFHGHVFEGYFPPAQTAVFIRLERLLARWTDALIAVSLRIQHELLTTYRIGHERQFHIVPLGFDLTPFAALNGDARRQARSELGIPDDTPVVTFVGRLTAIKQPELFLGMARLVANRHAGMLFLIVGDGELRKNLEGSVADHQLGQRVRFLGWRRDMCTIYGATDVLALTSRNEGTPVAAIEAMAAGVPVVSTNVGGVSDIIDDPRLGVLVPPGSAAALADAVCSLLFDSHRRSPIDEAARCAVQQRHSVERLVTEVSQLYGRLLGRVPPHIHPASQSRR